MLETSKTCFQKIRNSKILNYLFITGVLLFTFLKVFEYSQVIDLSSKQRVILRILTILCLFPKVIFQEYTKKEFYVAISILVFTVSLYAFSNSMRLFILPMILIGIKGIDLKKLMKYICIITSFAVILHTIVFYISYYLEFNTLIGITNWINPTTHKVVVLYNENNFYSERVTLAILEYIYCTDRNKNRYLKFFVLLSCAVFVLVLTKSRTAFAIAILAIAYLLFENNEFFKKNINKIKYICLGLFVILSIIVLFGGHYLNDSSIINIIDDLLSHRPYWCTLAKDELGISLLPNFEAFNILIDSIPVDSAVTGLLLKWGLLLFSVFIIFAYVFAIKNKNDTITNYFIAIMSLWLVTEVYPIELLVYPLLMMIFSNFYKYNN